MRRMQQPPLIEIVADELQAHRHAAFAAARRHAHAGQAGQAGADAVIAPNDALSLGLLIHELVTNAAKYGALSTAAGTLSLTWSITDGQQILFDWRERGGPAPAQDRKRGFGSDLIEKVISRELRSDIKLEFPASGVHCTFAVPIRSVNEFALRTP